MGKCIHGDFRKKTRMSNSLSHLLKENPKIIKERKKKKKCGRIPGLAGRTGAVGASMSDLRFDLHIKFFYGVCSQILQCTH